MDYRKRRSELLKGFGIGSVAVLRGGEEKVRNNDVHYDFRQCSSFYYLSGCNEPGVNMVLLRDEFEEMHILFKKEQTELDRVCSGHTVPFDEEREAGGWDLVLDISEFDSFAQGVDEIELPIIMSAIEDARSIKSGTEISRIRKAVAITAEAFDVILERLPEFTNERQVSAEIDYLFAKRGVEKAYQSIVASGNNGNTLHYTKNDDSIGEGEMILMDVGCEYGLYASDITRTYPSKGVFSDPQRVVYQAVLDIQKKLISMVRPGMTFGELNEVYAGCIVEVLVVLGVLSGDRGEIEKEYKRYSPHSVGHWLGLDVHDRNPYKDSRDVPVPFEARMVITIEPGLYFQEDDETVPEEYRGIAVRIEDDVLVLEGGREVLSSAIPKEVEDIEGFER